MVCGFILLHVCVICVSLPLSLSQMKHNCIIQVTVMYVCNSYGQWYKTEDTDLLFPYKCVKGISKQSLWLADEFNEESNIHSPFHTALDSSFLQLISLLACYLVQENFPCNRGKLLSLWVHHCD